MWGEKLLKFSTSKLIPNHVFHIENLLFFWLFIFDIFFSCLVPYKMQGKKLLKFKTLNQISNHGFHMGDP